MEKNILLIEPAYKNKYPPLGLMKISYFHKNVLHDNVRFVKGKLPDSFDCTKWDHVYVTSLFTFEWATTIASIEYAKTLVDSIDKITVGGIAATMLPEDIYNETGIRPVTGLLNEPGKLGLPGDECIDQIVPDYAILNDVKYVYPFHDAYFLSATKGCGNNCGFCAVQTLEPKFIPYIDIKEKIKAIDIEYGQKKDLLLMDNNVLRSPKFNDIIDDILEAGFEKGATYISPTTGKTVKRYVDFNQGLDALFLTEEKARRLGEIALRPARIAFDHIEDKAIYEKAMRLCAKHGINYLSNYVLYNSENFGGKGREYSADTPADLYNRMRITLDIRDDINRNLSKEEHVAAFSFPMRYIPLSAHERGYIGTEWNAKFLRAVQCMLIPAQGKGVGSRSFFEADFGKNAKEFEDYLCMPERLIAVRGQFDKGKRKYEENTDEFIEKQKIWRKNQENITEWRRLFELLEDDRNEFVSRISDNEFLPEKVLGIKSDIQKKLYLHYLTKPRIIALLGMINRESNTYELIKQYLLVEYRPLYTEIVDTVTENESQQQYIFTNFIDFFGKQGLIDIVKKLELDNFSKDRLLAKWDRICKKKGTTYIDFELIRIYRRFYEADLFSSEKKDHIKSLIRDANMADVAKELNEKMPLYEEYVLRHIEKDLGHKLLVKTSKTIIDSIQFKLFDYFGE